MGSPENAQKPQIWFVSLSKIAPKSEQGKSEGFDSYRDRPM